MGLSRAEFHHSIKALLAGCEWSRTGECYRISEADAWVELEAGAASEQHLGSLVMPRTEVHIRSDELDRQALGAFIRRFEIAFQRGGG